MGDENNQNSGDEHNTEEVEQQGSSSAEGTHEGQSGEGGEGQNGEGQQGGKNTVSMSEEKFAEILSTVVGSREGARQEEKEPELTKEQVEKLLNVYKVDEKTLVDMLGEDRKVGATTLQKVIDAVVLQANTMADARIQQVLNKLHEERLAPLERFYQEAQANRETESFYTKNPELKPYEFVVDGVSAKLDAANFKGSKEQFLAEIARTSHEVLKAMGVTVKKGANGNNANRVSSGGGSRMSSLSTGSGQRSAGGGGDGQKNRKPGMAIFDDQE